MKPGPLQLPHPCKTHLRGHSDAGPINTKDTCKHNAELQSESKFTSKTGPKNENLAYPWVKSSGSWEGGVGYLGVK